MEKGSFVGSNNGSSAIDKTKSKNAQAERHMGLVVSEVKKIMLRVPYADENDLLSAGSLGLMRALEHFDPNRGYAFSTYAVPKIQGAILDELREQDPVSRPMRRKIKDMKLSIRILTNQLGRPPTDRELATQLGITERQLGERQLSANGMERPLGTFESFIPHSEKPADERMEREEEFALILQALGTLPESEQKVLTMLYLEERTQIEIAKLLKVSGSRINQLVKQGLKHLKEELDPKPKKVS